MTGSEIDLDFAGGPMRHIPVMLNEVLDTLKPAPGLTIVDGTFGAGGYTRAILDQGADVIAIDRDPNAVRDGQDLVSQSDGRLVLAEGEFSKMNELVRACGHDFVDGVVLDIGVSSMQIDEAERGFSFKKDGPLDMRMAAFGVTAADVVNHAKQQDLTRIIGILGEEKKASQVSRAIVREREAAPFHSTLQLANLIEKTIPRRAQDKIHPATRTFQALRIFVNGELEQLALALFAAERLLKAGGRLVVVTFHSLEDRIVKLFFKHREGGEQGSRHMPSVEQREAGFEARGKALIKARDDEAQQNPRARSAKLRWGERTGAPAQADDLSIFGLPNLVGLSSFSSIKGALS